jgi:hypothetical protein
MEKNILCAFLRPLAPSACGLISARKDPEMWNGKLRPCTKIRIEYNTIEYNRTE